MEEQFGPYLLQALIGRGGMGEVYRAFDTQRGRTVALKLLPPDLASDETFKARFRRESRMAARLNEPHVIPIHDFGEVDGRLFLDMRLVEGVDLSTMVEAEGELTPAVAVDVVGQVAAALGAAHDSGLVHRDVKPNNVLVTGMDEERSGAFAYLVDFGIARALPGYGGTALTTTSATVGTLAYMAPERISGDPGDHRADIYSLGCVLYECLTGRPPYLGETFQVMYAHVNHEAPSLRGARDDVPAPLDEAYRRAVAKDPAERFQTTGQFARAMRAAVATLPIERVDVATPPATRRHVPAPPGSSPRSRRTTGTHTPPAESGRATTFGPTFPPAAAAASEAGAAGPAAVAPPASDTPLPTSAERAPRHAAPHTGEHPATPAAAATPNPQTSRPQTPLPQTPRPQTPRPPTPPSETPQHQTPPPQQRQPQTPAQQPSGPRQPAPQPVAQQRAPQQQPQTPRPQTPRPASPPTFGPPAASAPPRSATPRPDSWTPVPGNPVPGNPAPGNPAPGNPVPGNQGPVTPMPGGPPPGYRPPGSFAPAGPTGPPPGGGGYQAPPASGGSGRRRTALVGGAVVAALVVVGLVVAAAGGAFSGSPTTPVSSPVTSAALGDDFGTGPPTASTSGSGSPTPSGSASDAGYDTTAPTEDQALDVAQQYFVATSADDLESTLALVCPEYRADFEANLPDDEFSFTVDSEASSYDDTSVDDGARQLDYTLKVTLDDGDEPATLDFSLLLRNIDGDTFVCGRTYDEA